MSTPSRFVVFTLDEQRYALPLSSVNRVVAAVYVTPLPKAPDIVRGVINVQGQVIPVVDIRTRFRLPEREMALSDQIIIAHTAQRPVALIADATEGVLEFSDERIVPPEAVLPEMEYVGGVVRLDEDLLLIHDLDRFLSLQENKKLDAAMSKIVAKERRK